MSVRHSVNCRLFIDLSAARFGYYILIIEIVESEKEKKPEMD